MSIRIDKITGGRFGNKILQYNSLVQIANNNNIKASIVLMTLHIVYIMFFIK